MKKKTKKIKSYIANLWVIRQTHPSLFCGNNFLFKRPILLSIEAFLRNYAFLIPLFTYKTDNKPILANLIMNLQQQKIQHRHFLIIQMPHPAQKHKNRHSQYLLFQI